MEILGKISGDNLVAAYDIAQQIELSQEVHSYYAPNRIEKWFRYGSNLQSIPKGRARIEKHSEPHPRLTKLGDRLYPNWHSLLVCGGNLLEDTSTSIQWHRDHGHFAADAIMLNLGQAIYREQPDRGSDRIVEHHLTEGLIVRINTKLLHCAEQVSQTRYNFTFRSIKAEYLP